MVDETRTYKTISTSIWYVKVKERNSWVDRKAEVLVVGNDTLKISRDKKFLARVYQELFKKKWKSKMNDNVVKVIRLELLKNLGESFSNEYELEEKEIQ